MAKNRLLCLDEVFFIILNKKVYKYKHIVYIIIMNLTKEKKMDELTIKAEKIISDIFNGKYTTDKQEDPCDCVRCGKELHGHNHWEFDLDVKGNSSWHKDYDGISVTGFFAIGLTCAKRVGIYKTLKEYKKAA
tara:strand:- start:1586 stop:1984 length:399 start_codon:yes stop_codon:yes gene_type:complete